MNDIKQIYWVEVIERVPGTLDSKQIGRAHV